MFILKLALTVVVLLQTIEMTALEPQTIDDLKKFSSQRNVALNLNSFSTTSSQKVSNIMTCQLRHLFLSTAILTLPMITVILTVTTWQNCEHKMRSHVRAINTKFKYKFKLNLVNLYARIIWLCSLILVNDQPINDSNYVPKSKRGFWAYRMKMGIINCTLRAAKSVEQFVDQHTTTTRLSPKRTNRSRVLRHNRTLCRRRLTTLAMMSSIVVMDARHAKPRERMGVFDTDSRTVGIDNRASACISNTPGDFEGPLRKCQRAIKGFGGTKTYNVFQGTLKWSWEDDDGKIHIFLIPKSYYIPDGNVRLLSPQHWAKTQKDTKPIVGTLETTDHKSSTLQWKQRKFKKTVQIHPSDNVATFHLAPGYLSYERFCSNADVTITDEDKNPMVVVTTNIIEPDDDEEFTVPHVKPLNPWKTPSETPSEDPTPPETPHTVDMDSTPPQAKLYNGIPIVEDDPQREEEKLPSDETLLLQYHHRFGHVSFQRLKDMAKLGIIPKRLAKCQTPVCSSCMFAKASKRPWRNKSRKDFPTPKTLDPGDVISVDQMVSPTPGLIAQITGILTTKRYKYATVYVDQATRFGYTHLQKTATADETIEGKVAFEKILMDRGIKVKAYHADNGIFRANAWRAACTKHGQGLTFAGVNAHHANGIAEKRIRDLQDLTRTQLIHATRRWKQCITVNLWPYALLMANDVLNNTPQPRDAARRTAEQIISKTVVNINAKHYMPFGCPCYVLESALQQNKPHYKWGERAKVGIYLGPSPQHGRNVSLVLSRKTGLVSPQFHIKYDPKFRTTKQDQFDSQWQSRSGFLAQREKVATQPKKRAKSSTRKPTSKRKNPTEHSEGANQAPKSSEGATALPSALKRMRAATPGTRRSPRFSLTPIDYSRSSALDDIAAANNQQKPSEMEPVQPTAMGEPEQVEGTTPATIAQPQVNQFDQPHLIEAMITEITHSENTEDEQYVRGEIFCYTALCPEGDTRTMRQQLDPIYAFKSTVDPDTLYYHEAMKEEDRDQFSKAMQKEYDDRLNTGVYALQLKSKLPKDATVLPVVWQLKRKRDIKTRVIKKYKARLNIDGSRMQKGKHYDQTYAPVASWNSIRLLLTMTAVHGWHTKQLDYVAAFPQAPVERELYMKIPKGIKVKVEGNVNDYVLKLHRNIYGQKQAGRVWNDYLVKKLLKEVGFKQSKEDQCLFYHGQVMYVLYTDDSILAGPDPKEIDRIIKKMRKAKLDITIEGDLEDFLGVNIDRKEDGTIHLTQPHLIDSILKDLNLDGKGVKPRSTPASSSKILKRHEDSKDFDGSFNYRSVIGKLNYLERGSRSDIAYITHQCARFTSNPKREHGEAIRWLGRYLLATRYQGTILKPDHTKDLELWVDADFCGNFDPKDGHRDNARSRHGYYINYKGCPVTWKSQLQTEITLSSTESEYTGLSYALRDAIPLMNVLKEMKHHGFPVVNVKPKVRCEVFEDNSGALEIAMTHKYRPRTKHISVKHHHFRDYVTRGEILVSKVGTEDQLADILTKPVNEQILVLLRRRVMGW